MIITYVRQSRTDNCNSSKQLISTNIVKTWNSKKKKKLVICSKKYNTINKLNGNKLRYLI